MAGDSIDYTSQGIHPLETDQDSIIDSNKGLSIKDEDYQSQFIIHSVMDNLVGLVENKNQEELVDVFNIQPTNVRDSEISCQVIGQKLNILFKHLANHTIESSILNNLNTLISRNPAMLNELDALINFKPQVEEKENREEYCRRITCSLKALGMLYKQGYGVDDEKLNRMLMIAAEEQGDIGKLATDFLFQACDGEEYNLLEKVLAEHFVKPTCYNKRIEHNQVKEIIANHVKAGFAILKPLIENIGEQNIDQQKSIIDILAAGRDSPYLEKFKNVIKDAFDALSMVITDNAILQEEFLNYVITKLYKHEEIIGDYSCSNLLLVTKNALEGLKGHDNVPEAEGINETTVSDETREEGHSKAAPLPRHSVIPKIEHDGRRYHEIKYEFKEINTHLPEGFIDVLLGTIDNRFECYEKSYKNKSTIYPCLEVLDNDDKDPNTNSTVRIKNINEYREEDIQGWAESIKQARLAGKSLKQAKEEAVRTNTALINKHYLQSRQTTSEGKPERRENFDDDSEDGGSDDDHWQKSETKSFGNCHSQEFLQEENEREDSGVVLTDDPEFFGEMLAVIKQAHLIKYHQLLRDVQAFAILLFFYDQEKGAFLQIDTGEGKSTIAAIKAAIWALKGHNIDIITSAEPLAIRDVEEREEFFALFGLSVAHNCSGKKDDWHTKNTVYGSVSNYQFAYLQYLAAEARGASKVNKRDFDVVLLDEADSMCIDNIGKIAMRASPYPGSCYLGPLHASIIFSQKLFKNQLITQDGGGYSKYDSADHSEDKKIYYINGPFEIKDDKLVLKDHHLNPLPEDHHDYQERILEITHLIYNYRKFVQSKFLATVQRDNKDLHIPSYLQELVEVQKYTWVQSGMVAENLKDNEQFVFYPEEDGSTGIAPVDLHHTGAIQHNTQWTNGQHQMLQIMLEKTLRSENQVDDAISILEYLIFYPLIFGTSGSLGGAKDHNILLMGRDANIFFVPPNKPKDIKIYDSTITENHRDHLLKLTEAVNTQTEGERAVLVICPTIDFVHTLEKCLKSKHGSRIRIYCSGDKGEAIAIKEKVDSGDIILATNIAGRGTDIKTTDKVEEHGGLHVLMASLAKNSRVEKQNIGRTARSGNKGSAELIINRHHFADMINVPIKSIEGLDMDSLRYLRNEYDSACLDDQYLNQIPQVKAKDKLLKDARNFVNGLPEDEAKKSQIRDKKSIFIRRVEELIEDRPNDIAFEDLLFYLGFSIAHRENTSESMFHAISDQIGHLYTPDPLKCSVLKHLAVTKNFEQKTFYDSAIEALKDSSDNNILKILSNCLQRNIHIITQEEQFSIGNKDFAETHPLYLAIFKNAQTGQVTYYSIKPLQGVSNKFIDANWKESLDEEVLVKLITNHEIFLQELVDNETKFYYFKGPKPNFDSKVNIDKIKELRDQNPELQKLVEENQSKIYFAVQKAKSDKINEIISNIFEAELKRFTQDILDIYNDGYKVVENPAYLINEGLKKQNLALLKLAQSRDIGFSFLADYYEAYLRIFRGGERNHRAEEPGEVDHDYVKPASDALIRMVNKLQSYVIPNIEALIILSQNKEDSELGKQLQSRKELAELIIKDIEKVLKKFEFDPNEHYLAIGDIKDVTKLYNEPDKAPGIEVGELKLQGMPFMFDVKLCAMPEPETDWFGGICMFFLSVIQFTIGFICISTGFVNLGATFISEGIQDLVNTINIFNSEQFNWENYFTQKGVKIAAALVLEGAARLFEKAGLITNYTGLFRAAEETKGFLNVMKVAAEQLATKYIVEKGIYETQRLGAKAIVSKFKHQIKEEVDDRINEYFARQDVQEKLTKILAAQRYSELDEIMRSVIVTNQDHFKEIFHGAIRNLAGSDGAHIMMQVINGVIEFAEAARALEKVSGRIREMLNEIDAKISHLANHLPNDEEQVKELLASFGYKRDVIDSAINELRQKGIIVDSKIVHIPSTSSALPSSIQKHGWSILGQLQSIADSHDRDCSSQINNYKAKLRQFAINSSTGELQPFARWFVDTATQAPAKKLVEKVKNATHHFFHGGKTARQKEAAELQRKAQEQIALNEELANQQRFFMEEMLSPYRRLISSGEEAYLLSNGWPSPDTATPRSNDKPQQIDDAQDNTNDDLFKNSFARVMDDDKGPYFGGGGFDIKSDTSKRPAKEKSIITKNLEPETSTWDKTVQVLDIAASLLSNFPHPWAKVTGKITKLALGVKKAHQATKSYSKLKMVKQRLDKTSQSFKQEANFNKPDTPSQLPAKEFKFEVKPQEVKPIKFKESKSTRWNFEHLSETDQQKALDIASKNIHDQVKKALKGNGKYKLDPEKPTLEQYRKLHKKFEKQIYNAQKNLKVEDSSDLYKLKIIGRGQKTGTWGHDKASDILARQLAKNPNVKRVYAHRQAGKWTGCSTESNSLKQLPDVKIETVEGKYHLIEFKSKSDNLQELRDKVKINLADLPEHMRGKGFVREIQDTKKLARELEKIINKK